MSAQNTTSPVRGEAGNQADGPRRRKQGIPARPPAVIDHLTALCRARQERGVTADVQAPAPGRYVLTVCTGRKELALTLAWRRRRWDLADIQLAKDGEPQHVTRSLYEVIRPRSDHETGTGPSSPSRGPRLPPNSALDSKKTPVRRV